MREIKSRNLGYCRKGQLPRGNKHNGLIVCKLPSDDSSTRKRLSINKHLRGIFNERVRQIEADQPSCVRKIDKKLA